jgi:nickel-dependent lactate racemase
MGIKKVKMTVNAFFGDNEIEVAFPENWDVQACLMAGHDTPALTDDQIRQALQSPIGTPRLSEMAKGKKQVCILFDDIPKPTQPSDIIPFVLEELHAGGIADDQIRFICAPGTHRYLTYPEFVAKLGQDIVEKYPVYNHNIWENLEYLGDTSRGTPVHINREYWSCDLRVAIGSIFPHAAAGFGGGGKIILPGVTGIETIYSHHTNIRENAELGRVDDNVFRADIEECARMAQLHFKIDLVINNHRQAIGLFAGDLVEEHREGVKLARQMYVTELASNADVVVSNSFPDESQMGRGMWPVARSIRDGGDVVLITHSIEGQNLHQLSSRFGTGYGGRIYNPDRLNRGLDAANRIIAMTPNLSRFDRDDLKPAEKVVWCRNWGEVMAELAGRHGAGTRVAVYPYAALQMPPSAANREDSEAHIVASNPQSD